MAGGRTPVVLQRAQDCSDSRRVCKQSQGSANCHRAQRNVGHLVEAFSAHWQCLTLMLRRHFTLESQLELRNAVPETLLAQYVTLEQQSEQWEASCFCRRKVK